MQNNNSNLPLQLMSDLHIEMSDETPSALSHITPKAKILILAGDIGRVNKFTQLKSFLEDVCKHFELVIYVLGNHEFYSVDGVKRKFMDEILNELEIIRKGITNLHILNRQSIIIDNVCITGCTLWSKTNIVPRYIIRIPGMDVIKYNALHNQDVKYIEHMIQFCKTRKLKLVVVTHHCPTHFVSQSTQQNDEFKSLYTTELDHLLTSDQVHTWICGHVHKNFDYHTEGGTRVVSNQKGKPKNNVTDFSKEKVVEI